MVGKYSQEKFADDIVNYIISRVTGTHPEDEVVNEKPSKSFLIGTLATRKERDLEDEVKLDDEGKAASIRASRLKISVLTAMHEIESNPEVTIKATGNVYYQIKTKKENAPKIPSSQTEDSDSQRDKKYQWKRLSFNHQQKLNIHFSPEFYVDFSQVRDIANKDPLISKPIPDSLWKAKIHVNKANFSEKYLLISFNYENESKEQNQHNEDQDQQQELSKQKEKEKKLGPVFARAQ